MNQSLIDAAREAWGKDHEIFWFDDDGIERFAAIIRRQERERCAKKCKGHGDWLFGNGDDSNSAAYWCEAAIRAMED